MGDKSEDNVAEGWDDVFFEEDDDSSESDGEMDDI